MSESKAVATELEVWASEQMGFSSVLQADKKQDQTDLLPLCKGSAMVGFWKEVINQVKSKTFADEIRLNLKLENLMAEASERYSIAEKNSRESSSLDKEIESLELQLHGHKDDLQDIGLEIKDTKDGVHSNQMKTCLHKNHSGYLMRKNTGLKSFQKWLAELSDTYYKQGEEISKVASNLELCTQEVKKLCCQLENNQSQSETGNKQSELGDSWCFIHELLKKFSPDVIVLSCQKVAEDSTLKLAEEEQNIVYHEQLQDIKSKYRIDDNDDEKNPLATIQNMLQRWELECVKTLTQCLNSRRNAENTLLRVDTERNNIVQRFQKEYDLSPTILQLLIDDLDAKVELASMQGCLRSFQAARARLLLDVQMKTQEHDQLLKLKNEIDGFSQTLAFHQERIIAITKHNSTVKAKLGERQNEVLHAAKSCVCFKQQNLSRFCTNLQMANRTCYTNLGHVDVNKIQRITLASGDSLPICQLDLYRSNSPAYLKCAHALRYSGHRAPSSLLQRIAEVRHELNNTATFDQEHSSFATEATRKCHHLNSLAKDGEEISDKHIASIRKKHKTGMEIAKQAFKNTQSLESMIKCWYEQPAQYQTPWITVNGLNWKQYKAKLENR